MTQRKSEAGYGRVQLAEYNRRCVTIAHIRDTLRPILASHGVERALVFGSYARGTQDNRSDIDLLIIKKTDAHFLDRFAEFADIYRALRGMAVDLLIYTPDEVARNAHRAFVRTILNQGVTIYER